MTRFFRLCLLQLMVGLVPAGAAHAVGEDRRVALVVGIDQYQDPAIQALPAAGSDARLISETLRRGGFDVVTAINPDRGALLSALGQLSVRSQNAAVSLFYFAGHGIEFESRNLLLPADMPKSPENGVVARGRSVTLDEVLSAMRGSAKVVIIDACRDNPLRFADSVTRSLTASAGLVEQRAEGFLTVYSAGRGQQALDGLFTRVLVEEAQKPNADFRNAVIATRQRVIEEARAKNHLQRPAYYDEMDGGFSLVRAAAAAGPPQQLAAATPPPPAPPAVVSNASSPAVDAPPPSRRRRVEGAASPLGPISSLSSLGQTRGDTPTPAPAPLVTADGGVAICQIGARVFAFSDGAWYAGRVLRTGTAGCKIRFDGFGADDDDDVSSSRILAWSPNGPGAAVTSCKKGDRIVGYSDQGWFPGKIRDGDGDSCTVRFDGYGSEDDEDLPLNLIRKL